MWNYDNDRTILSCMYRRGTHQIIYSPWKEFELIEGTIVNGGWHRTGTNRKGRIDNTLDSCRNRRPYSGPGTVNQYLWGNYNRKKANCEYLVMSRPQKWETCDHLTSVQQRPVINMHLQAREMRMNQRKSGVRLAAVQFEGDACPLNRFTIRFLAVPRLVPVSVGHRVATFQTCHWIPYPTPSTYCIECMFRQVVAGGRLRRLCRTFQSQLRVPVLNKFLSAIFYKAKTS